MVYRIGLPSYIKDESPLIQIYYDFIQYIKSLIRPICYILSNVSLLYHLVDFIRYDIEIHASPEKYIP